MCAWHSYDGYECVWISQRDVRTMEYENDRKKIEKRKESERDRDIEREQKMKKKRVLFAHCFAYSIGLLIYTLLLSFAQYTQFS